MADEEVRHFFSIKDITVTLIKNLDIHEGHWAIMVEFGLAATNAGPGPEAVSPAAIILVQRLGIQKVAESHPLALDAAVVNPKPGVKRGKQK